MAKNGKNGRRQRAFSESCRKHDFNAQWDKKPIEKQTLIGQKCKKLPKKAILECVGAVQSQKKKRFLIYWVRGSLPKKLNICKFKKKKKLSLNLPFLGYFPLWLDLAV